MFCLLTHSPVGDLSHLRTVKSEIHNRFAAENALHSFMMSAKSGDQVKACFLQIALTLTSITLPQRVLDPDSHTVRYATEAESQCGVGC